jgi:hypothetical protein
MDWADNQGIKKSVTSILKLIGIISYVLERFRIAVDLTEVLLRYEQIGKENFRPSENIKFYVQNTGFTSSANCLAFVLHFFCLCIIKRALLNRFWKPTRNTKWTRSAMACCQAYLYIFK